MLVNYFLFLALLLLLSGLALDAGLLEWRQVHLQNAADATAQEGMFEKGRADSSWASAAQAQATANGFTNGANNVTVTTANPPTSGTYSADLNSVQATISQNVPNLLMGLVNGGKSTLKATAVAKVIPTCVWMTNPSSPGNGSFWLLSTGMTTSNCGIFVNTSSGASFQVDGFSQLYSARNRAVAAATSNTSSGTVSPAPIFGAATKNDPLAYVTAPTFSSCGYTGTSIPGGIYTVSPGTYCGGISITNATITFSPGLYIIVGGLTISHSTLYGSGVTFYFTKQPADTSYGTVSFNYVYISMTAPTSSSAGGITGVLMYADRNWVDHGNQGMYIGDSTVSADGIWYLPNTGLSLYSTSIAGVNYFGLVIDNLYQYLGHSYPSASYSTLGYVSPIHYEDGVLVQ